MDTTNVPNLDVECSAFIEKYGTDKGRSLANKLGLKGPGSAKLATALSCFAWNAQTAKQCRLRGDITVALQYEGIADRIYDRDIRQHGIW